SGPCDVDDFVDRHERTLTATRRARERAVVADVAAELRQRNEDLRRVRDERPVSGLAQTPRLGAELLERRVEQRGRLHPEELKAPLAVPSSASGLGGTVARWRCIRPR